jgi:hypothetical protein
MACFQHTVSYRGIYAAHLFVEEVAPSIGWHIAAKINKRPNPASDVAEELPVCGAAHRLPRAESDKVVEGSSRWSKCEEQTIAK